MVSMDRAPGAVEGVKRVMAGQHRLLVVGGLPKDIPSWASSVFEIEQITGHSNGGSGRLAPEHKAEAVIICYDFVSHNFSEQAQRQANRWGVPWFGVRGGWSIAVEKAARAGLDWFVDALQGNAETKGEDDPERQADMNVVHNAWAKTVDYERERAEAATKRLGKEMRRREAAEALVTRQREAARRVVDELEKRHKATLDEERAKRAEIVEEFESVAAQAEEAIERLRQMCRKQSKDLK